MFSFKVPKLFRIPNWAQFGFRRNSEFGRLEFGHSLHMSIHQNVKVDIGHLHGQAYKPILHQPLQKLI